MPHHTRQSWSNDEDLALTQLAKSLCMQWYLIAQHFPSRSPDALRNRYTRIMDRVNAVAWEAWTAEEEQALVAHCGAWNNYGDAATWKNVAAHFPARTVESVRQRWKALLLDPPPYLVLTTTGEIEFVMRELDAIDVV